MAPALFCVDATKVEYLLVAGAVTMAGPHWAAPEVLGEQWQPLLCCAPWACDERASPGHLGRARGASFHLDRSWVSV